MNKQTKQQEEIIDLDAFDDVSLYQLIPSGKGMGQSHLKTIVDSIHYGRANINSILITGKEALQTHSCAFLRALGVENFNVIDASTIQSVYDLHIFFFGDEKYDGFVIENIEYLMPCVKSYFINILKTQQFSPYNFMEKRHEYFEIPGIIVMTTKNRGKVFKPILKSVSHVVELEEYEENEKLELIILQRLKYAKVEYESDYILKNIVRYGGNNLEKSIRFLKCCVAVMQADGDKMLKKEHVIRASRLKRLPDIENDEDIPF